MAALWRVLVVVVVTALAAPTMTAATAGPAPSLFPLVVGAEWVRVDDDGVTATSRVAGPKTVGGRPCVAVERKVVEPRGPRTFLTCYLATAAEVLLLEITAPRGALVPMNPPRPILKLPPKAGQTWMWSPAGSAVELKVTEKWIGEETVKVKAGSFRAWKLQTVTVAPTSEITTVTWYAPGVGAVRLERKGRRGGQQISGWNELVRYKIP